MREQRDAIHAILNDYGVPLVQCDTCLISGDLPSHGPYKPAQRPRRRRRSRAAPVSIAMLQ